MEEIDGAHKGRTPQSPAPYVLRWKQMKPLPESTPSLAEKILWAITAILMMLGVSALRLLV